MAARRLVAIGLAALAAVPPRARAECLPGGIGGGVQARIDRSVLALVPPLVEQNLPPRLEIPEVPFTVQECSPPFEDTVLTPHEAVAQLRVRSLQVAFVQGGVEVDAELDLELEGMLDAQICMNPIDFFCPVTVQARGATVHALLQPRVRACQPEFPVTEFALTADRDRTTVELGSCGLYDEIWSVVYGWFEDSILKLVEEELKKAVQQELPPLVAALTTGLLGPGMEFGGFRVSAALESASISPAAAFVRFGADVRPVGGPAACLPGGAALPAEAFAPAPAPPSGAMVSLAVSHSLVQRAVRSAWLAGLLCFDSRAFGLDLSTPLDFLAPGVQVDAKLTVATPPSAKLTGAGGHDLVVSADQVRVDVAMQVPGHEPSVLGAALDLSLAGGVAIDPAQQALVLALADASSGGAVVTAPGAALAFSGPTLQGLVDNLLLPAFAQSVGRLPLLSALFADAPVAVRIQEAGVEKGHLQAKLELHPKDPADRAPPTTVVKSAPGGPVRTVEIVVASRDDRTPERFLRHSVRVDGATDVDLRGGTSLVFGSLEHGAHRVSVAAMDLNGNTDPRPKSVDVFVDKRPPQVVLEGAPLALVRASEVAFSARAGDDRTAADALALAWTLSRIEGSNRPDTVLQEGTLENGGRLALRDLPEDVALRILVRATDEAGNRGEAQTAFYTNPDPTTDCASAGAGGWALAALLLLRARRRR